MDLRTKVERTVSAFAMRMRVEMNANVEHKGDWNPPEEASLGEANRVGMAQRAYHDLNYHSAKLAFAMREKRPAEVLEYAADVANMAMIVADCYGAMTEELLHGPGNVSRYPGGEEHGKPQEPTTF
jgi:hypothetical protein